MRLNTTVDQDWLVQLQAAAQQLDQVKPLAVRALERDQAEGQVVSGGAEGEPEEWPEWTDDWYWEEGRG